MKANWPNQPTSQKDKKLNNLGIFLQIFVKFGMQVNLRALHMARKFYGNRATTLSTNLTELNLARQKKICSLTLSVFRCVLASL